MVISFSKGNSSSKLYYREQSWTQRGIAERYKYLISNFLDSLTNNSVSLSQQLLKEFFINEK